MNQTVLYPYPPSLPSYLSSTCVYQYVPLYPSLLLHPILRHTPIHYPSTHPASNPFHCSALPAAITPPITIRHHQSPSSYGNCRLVSFSEALSFHFFLSLYLFHVSLCLTSIFFQCDRNFVFSVPCFYSFTVYIDYRQPHKLTA